MAGRASQVSQTAAILKVGEVARDADAVRAHLRRIVESTAMRGSKRSQEFLQFIVVRALEGHFAELKERTVGVELFGRAPAYDTGADAIVRVTACDVRRRLLQFYAENPHEFEYRIEIPPGSYIPEFRGGQSVARAAAAAVEPVETSPLEQAAKNPAGSKSAIAGGEPAGRPARSIRSLLRPVSLALAVCTLAAAAWVGFQRGAVPAPARGGLPWSAVLESTGTTHVIFCDPEIVTIQRLLDYSVTLPDYANQRYWPADSMPEVQSVIRSVSFRGVSVAAVDAATAIKIAGMPIRNAGNRIETHPARTVRLTDFSNDDNFILFGSPRSNPWVGLFQDQLGFRFEFDKTKRAEFVRNTRMEPGEASGYVPTAPGWGTGHAYAVVALVNNPNQNGHVLILAGSNAEATEAAGRFATNLPVVSQTLSSHGIDPSGAQQPFEILLHVSAMAGSPSTFEVIACHRLGKPENR
jgi:hypothetical protein